MGRYYTFSDGQEGKFWFACQPSGDVCDFGGQEESDCYIRWIWTKDEDLPIVNQKLLELSGELKLTTPYTYRSFMRRMNSKGYLGSSADPETNTALYKRASELCAKIYLGLKIRRGLKKQDVLSVEAET